jgi:hypothetical protein
MRHQDRSSASIAASFRWRPRAAGTGTALGLSAAVAALIGLPGVAHADYRLLFVTNDPIAATSSDISTYNTFAGAEAAGNALFPSTTWTAIVSTASVDAATNIECGATCDGAAAIYLPSGVEVAGSTNAMFGDSFMNAPNQNQFGAVPTTSLFDAYVWSGSNPDGTAYTIANSSSVDGTMGDASHDTAQGNYIFSSSSYLGGANYDGEQADQYPIYVISGDIPGDFPGGFVVTTPEPEAGAALLLGGLVVTGLFHRRRNRPTRAGLGLGLA